MIKCNVEDCKVNLKGRCLSGNGNLRAVNPFAKSPEDCDKTAMKYTKIGWIQWDFDTFTTLEPYAKKDRLLSDKYSWSTTYIQPGTIYKYKRKSGFEVLAISTNILDKRTFGKDHRVIYRLNEEGSKLLMGMLVENNI